MAKDGHAMPKSHFVSLAFVSSVDYNFFNSSRNKKKGRRLHRRPVKYTEPSTDWSMPRRPWPWLFTAYWTRYNVRPAKLLSALPSRPTKVGRSSIYQRYCNFFPPLSNFLSSLSSTRWPFVLQCIGKAHNFIAVCFRHLKSNEPSSLVRCKTFLFSISSRREECSEQKSYSNLVFSKEKRFGAFFFL